MHQATCISNFKFLASQEVLLLLQVFAVSIKEAKGTFLTPAKMISMIFFIIDHLVMLQATCISNLKFLASQEVLLLLKVFAVSLKEAKGTFLTPAEMTSLIFLIINHLVRPQGTCISNFKLLASQEVLLLLHVFAVSLKEVKGTFLIPAKMNSMIFSY